jgi:2-dehydropantoate 2-reductase
MPSAIPDAQTHRRRFDSLKVLYSKIGQTFNMKILIYGAGVIGSIYAARLSATNGDTTLLARGERYDYLKKNGINLYNKLTGQKTISHLQLTRQLSPNDFYHLIIVAVRMDQWATVLPVLKENTVCPAIMLLFNNPENPDLIANDLKPKHIILGFPGVGGIFHDNTIDYIEIRQQATTMGEIKGPTSPAIMEWKDVFEKAGFRVAISSDMQAWLKIHAIFVTCVTAAIIRENGDSRQLGRNRRMVVRMVSSIREGFIACRSLGISITPLNLKIIFLIMPRWFSVLYWQHAMKGKIGTVSMAPHARAAKEEMMLLAGKVMNLVHSSAIPTPVLDDLLYSFLQPVNVSKNAP